MPERVELAGTPLVLNGMGLREATFLNVDVYVAGLYLPSRSRDPQQILSQDDKRFLALQLVRDVTRDEMMEALTDGMKANAGDDFPRMQGRMQRLAGMLPELQNGSRIEFAYLPEQGIRVRVDDRDRGVLEGADFARVFYAIWLSEHAVDPDLREGLLGGGC